MSTSESEGDQASTDSQDFFEPPGEHSESGLWTPKQRNVNITGHLASAELALGVLRIAIHGSWSVADFMRLLGRLEDGYQAAAALESLASQPSAAALSGLTVGDLLETVTAFQLGGGLRLGSLHYGSPGFIEFIGALNPLKTVKDGITENRDINLKRDKTVRLDEREREQQAMHHKEAMARESRKRAEQQDRHVLAVARLQMDAEAARFSATRDLIDRLPADQQSLVAAQLIQRLAGATEAIANDSRVDEARMLDQAESDTAVQAPEAEGTAEAVMVVDEFSDI